MMIKQKKILINFIIWCIGLFLVCCVGISNVFALEYSTTYADTQYYYDNYGSSATLINSTWNSSLNAYVSSNLGTTANSYGGLVVFNAPIPIIANHTYTVSFSFIERYNIALSSKPNLSIGNTYDGTKYNYVNNQTYANTLVSKVVNNAIIQYSFTASGAASYIAIPWTTTSNTTQTYVFNSIIIEDLGSEGVSAQTIQDKLDNQAYYINQNIEYMKDLIIANQNSNNQAVIDNNNQNTQDIIDSNSICDEKTIDKSYIKTDNVYLNSSGSLANSNDWGVTDYIRFTSISYITSSNNGAANLCYYDKNKNILSCQTYSNAIVNGFTYTNSAYYVRFSIQKSNNIPKLKVNVCENGNAVINDSINNLNDSINNDNTDGATSEASSFFGNFNTNTFGLTSIITAPLNLIQSLTSKTCTPLHLPLPYLDNKYLDLPCMSTLYSEYFGDFYTLYQTITYGIIAYWVCVRIFNLVKDFKNPEHDEIEVVDL